MVDFRFKSYCPWIFRGIHGRFQVDPLDFVTSLTSLERIADDGTAYLSSDGHYAVKLISHSECRRLRDIMLSYYSYIRHFPNTLLERYLGLYRITVRNRRHLYLVVVKNVSAGTKEQGSQRAAFFLGPITGADGKKARGRSSKVESDANLLDGSWTPRKPCLEESEERMGLILKQLGHDVRFLAKMNHSHYFLQVGMETCGRPTNGRKKKTIRIMTPNGGKDREPEHVLNGKFRKGDRIFSGDEGGFRATKPDGTPLTTVYYIGLSNCLTKV